MAMYTVKVTFADRDVEDFDTTSTNVDEILNEVKEYYKDKVQHKYDEQLGIHTYLYYVITKIEITDKKKNDEFYENYIKSQIQ